MARAVRSAGRVGPAIGPLGRHPRNDPSADRVRARLDVPATRQQCPGAPAWPAGRTASSKDECLDGRAPRRPRPWLRPGLDALRARCRGPAGACLPRVSTYRPSTPDLALRMPSERLCVAHPVGCSSCPTRHLHPRRPPPSSGRSSGSPVASIDDGARGPRSSDRLRRLGARGGCWPPCTGGGGSGHRGRAGGLEGRRYGARPPRGEAVPKCTCWTDRARGRGGLPGGRKASSPRRCQRQPKVDPSNPSVARGSALQPPPTAAPSAPCATTSGSSTRVPVCSAGRNQTRILRGPDPVVLTSTASLRESALNAPGPRRGTGDLQQLEGLFRAS